jgi:CrcB protein
MYFCILYPDILLDMTKFLLVFLGSGAGGGLRFLISRFVHERVESIFPFGIFTVNMLACLIVGIISGVLLQKSGDNQTVVLLLITGFCGGFSTFSAITNDTVSLFSGSNMTTGILYLILTVLLGLLLNFFGLHLGKAIS